MDAEAWLALEGLFPEEGELALKVRVVEEFFDFGELFGVSAEKVFMDSWRQFPPTVSDNEVMLGLIE